MHLFETFSNPGPVDNSDFLCRHGGKPCMLTSLIVLQFAVKFYLSFFFVSIFQIIIIPYVMF